MSTRSLMASASRFAHLAGVGRPRAGETVETAPAGAGGEAPETDPPAARADEADGKPCPACDGTGENDDGSQCATCGGSGKAPDDLDASRAEGGGEDQDDDENEMHGRSAAAQARRRERARCAAIFSSPHALSNIPLAASLAFETTMTRKEALAVLKSQPRGAGASARAAANPRLDPAGQSHGSARDIQASWARAFTNHGAKPADAKLLRS